MKEKIIITGILLWMILAAAFLVFLRAQPNQAFGSALPLPPNQGGTGQNSTPTLGQILVGNSAGTMTLGSAGIASGGTGITAYTPGDILYASSITALAKLASSTGGKILQLDFLSGAPSWVATSTLNVQTPWLSNIDGGNFTLTNVAIASSTTAVIGKGSVNTPGIAFSGDPDSGMYQSNANQVIFAAGGVQALLLASTVNTSALDFRSGVAASFYLEQSAGLKSAPSYSFNADQNTGLWSQGADTLNLTAGGTEVFRSDAASTSFPVGKLGLGTTTPAFLLDLFSTGTTSTRSDSSSGTQGSCDIKKDSDGVGYTYVTYNNGVITASTNPCN